MKSIYLRTERSFTLIELIFAMTIFGIIFLSIFMIYTNIIETNQRLEMLSILQENTRLITESIASDVRENGIDFMYYDQPPVSAVLDYSGSGNTILAVKSGNLYYAMHADMTPCSDADMLIPASDCFVGIQNGTGRTRVSNEKSVIR